MTTSPPDTRPVRRLHRRTDRQVIGGVAAGMADYFNVDAVLVRIAFVVLIFVGGIGPLLYVLAWLFVPAADSGESIAQAALRRPASLRTYVGVALVLVAVAILASSVSRPSVIWAVALIAFGVFLFRQEPDAPARARSSGAPPWGSPEPSAGPAGPPPPVPPAEPPFPPAEPAAAAPATTGTLADAVTEPLEPRVAWGAPPPPRPPRSWSPLGPLTLGAAFLATGAAVALDNLGAVELTLGRALAVFLTVLGLGLLVGAWWGRAWSLIPVGLLLVPVVAAASLLGSEPVAAGAGNRLWQPRTVAEVQPSYRLGAGQAVVDLSGVRLGAPTRVDVGLGAGRIVVVVPDDAPVQLRGRVGIGSVTLLGRTEQGAKVDTSRTDGPLRPRKGDPPGRLTLDLHLGYGVIEVHRASELPLADVPGLTGPPPTTLREVP
jgi:phage shock protein PspC (stress-responsive transcriptional regulator)